MTDGAFSFEEVVIGLIVLTGVAVKVTLSLFRKITWPKWMSGNGSNGADDSSNGARVVAKLDSIARNTQETMLATQSMAKDIERMCIHKEIEDERHKTIVTQLDRIERKVES